MQEEPKYPKEVKLVTVRAYADKWNLNPHTVYKLMEDGNITRYLGLKNEPMLNPDEEPKGVRAFQERPEYPKNDDGKV